MARGKLFRPHNCFTLSRMLPALVHLHIPKSAGSSHRYYLYQVLGAHCVYSHGEHVDGGAFAPEKLQNFSVAEGHRPLDFYPPDMQALFTSVLRDPVERALSYFNYRAAPALNPEDNWSESRRRSTGKWLAKGLEPTSLLKTLEQCESFRIDVSNLQCAYCSRYGATFEGVLETIRETEIVVGLTEQLAQFNQVFREDLGFEIDNTLNLNVGSREHQPASREERGALRALNIEDQRFYDYVRDECGGLLKRITAVEVIRARLPVVNNGSNMALPPGEYNWSHVQLLSKGIVNVTPGSAVRVPLAVLNNGTRNLVFTRKGQRSCVFGWRLLDANGAQIVGAEGVASIELLVPPGSVRPANIDICIDDAMLQHGNASHIEFSVIADGSPVHANYPLIAAWSSLVHRG